MLVTFNTDVHADITMFGDIAVTFLKIMGHSGTVPGAIQAEDVPAALNRLRTAIATQQIPAPPAGDKDGGESTISLKNRAIPLIELFEAAAKAETYVMWK